MIYSIDLISRISVDINADSPKEAIEIAKIAHPNYEADFIMDEEEIFSNVVTCSVCAQILLDDDDCHFDKEHNAFCSPCNASRQESEATNA